MSERATSICAHARVDARKLVLSEKTGNNQKSDSFSYSQPKKAENGDLPREVSDGSLCSEYDEPEKKAPPGFEPGMADLQSAPLTT